MFDCPDQIEAKSKDPSPAESGPVVERLRRTHRALRALAKGTASATAEVSNERPQRAHKELQHAPAETVVLTPEAIDQLAEAHKALEASEERFRDLFDEAPIAYVHEELDTHFIRANRTARRILGITPEEVPTTYGATLTADTPDTQRRLREAFELIGRGADTSGVVLEMRRKDNGKPFWIQWWSRPDPKGKYTRTMFLDITDRVLMEQEKARIEAQNNDLLADLRGRYDTLTSRERDVMKLVISGLLNKQAAAELGISEITVKTRRGRVMRKMRASSLADLVRMASFLGIMIAESATQV